MYYLKLLFDPRGKIDRIFYVIAYLLSFLILFIPVLFFGVYNDFIHEASWESISNQKNYFQPLVYVALYISCMISLIFVKIKRFRDLNMSSFRILFFLVPILNVYYFFLLFLKRGTETNVNRDLRGKSGY